MKFKPITDSYQFDRNDLTDSYPDYLKIPIAHWIKDLLINHRLIDSGGYGYPVSYSFINELSLHLRFVASQRLEDFIESIFLFDDRVTNFLGFCLQNLAYEIEAVSLEEILSVGGSAYSVFFTINSSRENKRGISTLVKRMPNLVIESAVEILNSEELIKEAWIACYSRNPDYEKTVSKCCDALEKNWGKKYFISDPKPQVKKFVHAFKSKPLQLLYKGSGIVDPRNLLTDLAEKFSDIRGQHTAGKGRIPTKDEAEFVLHYSIFIFSIER